MAEHAWLVVLTGLPVLGTMLGAATYWLRERARWTAVTAVGTIVVPARRGDASMI
ncbi:hypothetical protein [Streptomyces sp. NPDC057301]|uniref:hypothetical protein n=1 Tax=Streptomyces sp. NPDC057301 TaxID=3346093 RepID=UPI003644FE64